MKPADMGTKRQNDQSPLPPAVMVHAQAQAQRVLEVGRPVTLLSSPAAAGAWGCLWWQKLLEAALHTGPAVLDCGASPGRAVEALELGLRGLVLAPCVVWAEVAALAAQKQAMLLPTPPEALDMGQKPTQTRLMAWLGG